MPELLQVQEMTTKKKKQKLKNLKTAEKKKKNRKTQEVTYDYSGLASTICNIVIKHYFAD